MNKIYFIIDIDWRGMQYMKKFFKEFKQFISRGNVMNMAIGVIIGSAFSSL